MIWYEEELQCRDQPEATTIKLTGIYNTPGTTPPLPTIVIRVFVEEDKKTHSTVIPRTLFHKSPTMLNQEEPASEDVLAKYQSKILKFKEKIQNATFAEINAFNDPL